MSKQKKDKIGLFKQVRKKMELPPFMAGIVSQGKRGPRGPKGPKGDYGGSVDRALLRDLDERIKRLELKIRHMQHEQLREQATKEVQNDTI
jgi:hypothetical protein